MMIWCAAIAMAWSPELQNRLTVWPETVTGQPAHNAALRAIFMPVSPSVHARENQKTHTPARQDPLRRLEFRVSWKMRTWHTAPHDDILNHSRIDSRSLDRVFDHVATECRTMRHVEATCEGRGVRCTNSACMSLVDLQIALVDGDRSEILPRKDFASPVRAVETMTARTIVAVHHAGRGAI